jgi:hypothetical protein
MQQSNKMLSLSNYFNDKFEEGIHYISIGCATIDKGANSKMQQFPPFLQKIKKNEPSIPIFLILIDPILEQIPQCIIQGNDINSREFVLPSLWDSKKEIKWNNNQYTNVFTSDNKIKVLCFNEYVEWNETEHARQGVAIRAGAVIPTQGVAIRAGAIIPTQGVAIRAGAVIPTQGVAIRVGTVIPIYKQLLAYNKKIIESKNSLLFVHDFSGRNMSLLTNKMDLLLKDNLKYIMYDISLRGNEVCYLNEDVNCEPQIKLNNRLEIVNPFLIKNKDMFDVIKKQEEIENQSKIIRLQIKKVIFKKIDDWYNTIFALYRQMNNLCVDSLKESSDNIINNHINTISNTEILSSESLGDIKRIFLKFNEKKDPNILFSCMDLIKIELFIRLRDIIDIFPFGEINKNSIILGYQKELDSYKNIYQWGDKLIIELKNLLDTYYMDDSPNAYSISV